VLRLASVLFIIAASLFGPAASAADAARQITIADLAGLRDIDGLAVSPNGEMAIVQIRTAHPATNRYHQSWVVVEIADGSTVSTFPAGAPILPSRRGRINGAMRTPAPVWSADSQWVFYLRRDSAGAQVWRARANGADNTQITNNPGSVTSAYLSQDGSRILFATELSDEQLRGRLETEGLSGFLYDGRYFPNYSATPILWEENIWVVDAAGGGERRASNSERDEFSALRAAIDDEGPLGRPATRAADGRRAWFEPLHEHLQGGLAPVALVAQAHGDSAPVVCVADECIGEMFDDVWFGNDGEVLFVRRESRSLEYRALYAWQPTSGRVRRVLRTRDVFTSFQWECGPSRYGLVCLYEQPNYPRRLVAIDATSGAVETILDPNPDFAEFDLGQPPTFVDIQTPTGVSAWGYLVMPPGRTPREPLPVIVVTYRCAGFLRGGVGDEYPIYAFAAEGFAVFCFDAPTLDMDRLASMSWPDYQNWLRGPGDPEKRRTQEALNAALCDLDARGIIDPRRIGLTGLSFGAETVTYALFNIPRLGAAIASGTEVGPASTYLYGPSGRRVLIPWGLDTPTSERWDHLSITRNVESVSAPLLLHIADRELGSALPVFTALDRADRAVEMFVFPDEFHTKWQPAHRLSIYRRNVDWMNFWLRGRRREEPGLSPQYERWEALRPRVERARVQDERQRICTH